MRISFILLPFFVFYTVTSSAQKISIGAGPVLAIPVSNNNFNYYWKNGFGGNLQANFRVSKLGSLTANITYLSIRPKNLPAENTSLSFIKAGYQTYFLNSRIFAGADGGIAFYKNAPARLVLGANAGYSFKVGKRSHLDLFPSLNFLLRSPSNNVWLNANVLYRFSIGKK
jgi:hypothetical protein